jgi:DNA replication protein DnaC
VLTEQTLEKLRRLRLPTMASALEQRIQRGDHRDVSPEEFLGLLVDDEFTARQNRKLSRLIGQANFKPEQACLENIKYDPLRGFQKTDVLQFTSTRWITNAQNVIFTGATGTGKTYLAEALGVCACTLGYRVRKIRYKRLWAELQGNKGAGLYLDYLEKLNRTTVLIIDDFLMDPIDAEQSGELLHILEERALRAPLVLTTQYPIDKWHELLPNPTIADAICDRLRHGSIIINLKGESMRKIPEKT